MARVGTPLNMVNRLTTLLAHDGELYVQSGGYPGSSAPRVASVAGGLFAYAGWSSIADAGKFKVTSTISIQADLIRLSHPNEGEFVEFAGISWSESRLQAASNAAQIRDTTFDDTDGIR